MMRILTPDLQLQWLFEQADVIRNQLCPILGNSTNSISLLRSQLDMCHAAEQMIDNNCMDGIYTCSQAGCSKVYKRRTTIVKHLQDIHGISTTTRNVPKKVAKSVTKTESLVHLLLLIRDLHDAYKHCDGDRIFIDIKFVLLHFFRLFM